MDGCLREVSSITFGQKLQAQSLHLPEPAWLPNSIRQVPYELVEDDVFALCETLLKPYNQTYLNNPKRIFNYRLNSQTCCRECFWDFNCSTWFISETYICITREGTVHCFSLLLFTQLPKQRKIKCIHWPRECWHRMFGDWTHSWGVMAISPTVTRSGEH